MYRILWNGQSAMNANQSKLEVISNNIANMGTNGYKRVDVSFKELVTESLEKRGYPTNNSAFTGTGVKVTESSYNKSQAVLLSTDGSTDFGLDGEGMFKVVNGTGDSFYTRDGAFKVDINGEIVNSRGDKLVIEYKPGYEGTIFDAKNIFVDKSGNISMKNTDGSNVEIARIPLYSAIGDEAFQAVGGNLFKVIEGIDIYEVRDTGIYQGTLEGSNVDIGEEFADMIMTQRVFQLGSKSINTADEMWGMINDLRR